MIPRFVNPVVGPIHDESWVRPATSLEFKVTSTFAQHVASGRGPGIDVANGHCGGPILAMADGVVSMATVDSIGVSIVRVRHPQWPGYESGYCHMPLPFEVAVGQVVKASQRIATVGAKGASACHLHGGCKYNGVEVDWWPFLIQNQEAYMPSYKPAGPFIGTFKIGVGHALISTADTTKHYAYLKWPGGVDVLNVVAVVDLKTPAGLPIDIEGKSPPLNHRDQVYLVDLPGFGVSAFALRQDGVFSPTVGGFTQDQLNAAVKAASDPLNLKIANGLSSATASVAAATATRNALA
jgi:hypothetical protein